MKVLKWIGIVLAGLLGILLVAGLLGHFAAKSKIDNAPEVASRPVAVPTDAEALARGERLAREISGCAGCHSDNLGGEVFIDGEFGLYITAPNLTSGAGGTSGFSDVDWERAIRHGVGADGRTLAIMPSSFYQAFSDDDLGALIAYLKSVPPVDNDLGPRRIGFPGSFMASYVAFDEFTHVNRIDHETVGGAAIPEATSAEYGEYMVSIALCGECHAPNMAGIPAGGDGPPPGPNLTPGGHLADWDEAGFIQTIRTGQTPDGHELDPEMMPYREYAGLTDVELQAIWAYLSSLPALPSNG